MSKTKTVSSFRSFLTFTSHFIHFCYVLRGMLGMQLLLVLSGGVLFALCENISIGQGVYFSLITATTVGYGDISPETILGQCLSVFIALIGTVHFGLLVAVATQAFTVTIKEYRTAISNAR